MKKIIIISISLFILLSAFGIYLLISQKQSEENKTATIEDIRICLEEPNVSLCMEDTKKIDPSTLKNIKASFSSLRYSGKATITLWYKMPKTDLFKPIVTQETDISEGDNEIIFSRDLKNGWLIGDYTVKIEIPSVSGSKDFAINPF